VKVNPEGSEKGAGRVNRGGSWFSAATFCRVALRYGIDAAYTSSPLGFRIVMPVRKSSEDKPTRP